MLWWTLRKLFSANKWVDRERAAIKLAKNTRAVERLLHLIESRDGGIRMAAARALGDIAYVATSDPSLKYTRASNALLGSVDPLLTLLRDDKDYVQSAAATALMYIARWQYSHGRSCPVDPLRKAVDPLISMLQDSRHRSTVAMTTVAMTLAQIGDTKAIGPLISVVNKNASAVTTALFLLLKRNAHDVSDEDLESISWTIVTCERKETVMGDYYPETRWIEVRYEKYEDVRQLARKELDRRNLRAISQNEPAELSRAVLSIARYSDDRQFAEDLCVRLTVHANASVRGNAVRGLGYLACGSPERAEHLKVLIEKALRDEDTYVRGQAESAAHAVEQMLQWRVKHLR